MLPTHRAERGLSLDGQCPLHAGHWGCQTPLLWAREDAEPWNPPSEAYNSVRRTNRWKRRFHSQSKKAVEGYRGFHCWTKQKMIKDQRKVLWAPSEVKSVCSPFPFPPGWSTRITRQRQAGLGHILPALLGPCWWSLGQPCQPVPTHTPPHTPHCQLSERDPLPHFHRLSLSLQPRLRTHRV